MYSVTINQITFNRLLYNISSRHTPRRFSHSVCGAISYKPHKPQPATLESRRVREAEKRCTPTEAADRQVSARVARRKQRTVYAPKKRR